MANSSSPIESHNSKAGCVFSDLATYPSESEMGNFVKFRFRSSDDEGEEIIITLLNDPDFSVQYIEQDFDLPGLPLSEDGGKMRALCKNYHVSGIHESVWMMSNFRPNCLTLNKVEALHPLHLFSTSVPRNHVAENTCA